MAIALVILLLAVPVVVQVAWEVRTVRRAGMSDATPVCANCHYPLGGWSSPRCPECGKDIQAIGVRTGPRIQQVGLGVLVVLSSIFVIGPVSWNGIGWVLDKKESETEMFFSSESLSALRVRVVSAYQWSRFPPKNNLQTSVEVKYVNNAVLTFGHDEPIPEKAQLRHAFINAGVAKSNTEVVHEHVEILASILRDFRTAESGNPYQPLVRLQSPIGPFMYMHRGGYWSTHMPSEIAPFLAIAIVFVAMYLGLREVRRRSQCGWRMPLVGEWAKQKE